VAEIVEEISSSEYAIHHRLSRFKWMPLSPEYCSEIDLSIREVRMGRGEVES